jgi:hypothetical protein
MGLLVFGMMKVCMLNAHSLLATDHLMSFKVLLTFILNEKMEDAEV